MVLHLWKPGAPPVDQLACPESLLLEGQRQRHRMHARAMKSVRNPNTINTTMQREEK
jgi:hypothetical protein